MIEGRSVERLFCTWHTSLFCKTLRVLYSRSYQVYLLLYSKFGKTGQKTRAEIR